MAPTVGLVNDRATNAMTDQAVNKSKTSSVSSPTGASEEVKTDTVSITEQTQILKDATCIANDSDGIDYQKVEELKQQIHDGTYQVDYESLANKIVDSEDELSSIF